MTPICPLATIFLHIIITLLSYSSLLLVTLLSILPHSVYILHLLLSLLYEKCQMAYVSFPPLNPTIRTDPHFNSKEVDECTSVQELMSNL